MLKKEWQTAVESMLMFENLMKYREVRLPLTLSEINSIDKDGFTNERFEDFEEIDLDNDEYSEYCYCISVWGAYTGKPYFFLRISRIEIVDNNYYYFVAPAHKIVEDMAKVKIHTHNKLELVPGEVVSIEDIPKLKLTPENSYYDKKLKKRVPILGGGVNIEVKKKEANSDKPKSKSAEKKQSELINNSDTKIEGQSHSSDFLPPFISTRIWVLKLAEETGWGWFTKQVEGYKKKIEYYCRPIEIVSGMEQYDLGGVFFTNAYRKSDFKELDIEEISHERILMFKENNEFEKNTTFDIAVSVMIDAIMFKPKLEQIQFTENYLLSLYM